MSTKENGLTTKPMEEELIFTWMEQNTQVTGEKTNSTDSVLKHGQMALDMKVIMSTGKSTEQALSSGQMAQCTLGNSTIIIFTEKVSTLGVMDVNMRVSGEITKCTVEEHLLGRMEESTLVNMLMTRNKDMVNSSGLMEDVTRETGTMENSMAKEFMLRVKVPKDMENGETEKELDGLEEAKESNENKS